MTLQMQAWFGTGQDELDTDMRDLRIVAQPQGWTLYASTGPNGGLAAYTLGTDGRARLTDTVHFGETGSGLNRMALEAVDLGSGLQLVVGGADGGGLVSYRLKIDGDLGAASELPSDLPGKDLAGWTTVNVDGEDQLILARDGKGSDVWAETDEPVVSVTGNAILDSFQMGGETYVLATGTGMPDVTSYRLDTGSGALTAVSAAGAEQGLGLATPTAMITTEAFDVQWAILAAAGTGTLSVMRIDAGGAIVATDHLLDTLETRFGGVTALEAVEVDGRVFVFAGGADDGLTVFTLLPNGRLLHLQSLGHSLGAGLDNVTDIEALRLGDEIQIFVASADAGLTRYSWPVADLGDMVQDSDAQGSRHKGTSGDDLMIGQGPDTLVGGDGDDILVGGIGAILKGDGGADTFVVEGGEGEVRIDDFDLSRDRIDLSALPMLRGPGQFKVRERSDGLQLDFGSLRVRIETADKSPLTLADLWATGRFQTPDRLLYEPMSHIDQPIMGTDGNDMLEGSELAELMKGLEGNDTILAGVGDDTIRGATGNDLIGSGGGNDKTFGGAGTDTVFGNGGNDTIEGRAGNDKLWGGNGDDVIYGGSGEDTIGGGEGNDTLDGQTHNDLLQGIEGNDVLIGGNGDDTLMGGRGLDTLDGGDGNDELSGAQDADDLTGGLGNDTLNGDGGQDTIAGGAGDDRIRGGTEGDEVTGDDGDDLIHGGGGADQLEGNAGSDTIWGMSGADLVLGRHGDDTLGGGNGNDTLGGGKGEDLVIGGAGNDVLNGGDDSDVLNGQDGRDTLHGGTGRDTLTGEAGNDVLTGGIGADTFVFGRDHGNDRIEDFAIGQDKIHIADSTLRFADLTLSASGGGTLVSYTFGDIMLDGIDRADLSASDFLFV